MALGLPRRRPCLFHLEVGHHARKLLLALTARRLPTAPTAPTMATRWTGARGRARAPRTVSETRPLRASEAILVPVVRVTGVLPQARTVKLDGALMSYHSFFVKGSTLPSE